MNDSKVLKEANSIPDIIYNFNKVNNNPYEDIKNIILDKKIKLIVTIARGTSDCAALYASYLVAKSLGIPTYSMPPSLITLENVAFDFSSAIVIVISQSGVSEDLIQCERAVHSMGAKTIIITNNINSPIISSADYFINMYAGKEESIAATKSYILTLVNLTKLVAIISNNKEVIDKIDQLPEILRKESQNSWDPKIIDSSLHNGFIISRGLGYALSTEISLKFKELCQEQVEPFSSAEVMHGPRSLIQDKFKLFIVTLIDKSGKIVSKNIDELKQITNKLYELKPKDSFNSPLSYTSTGLVEIDSIILMSKFYPWIIKYSILKGLDPDKPRYLTKVTSTF